MKTLVVLTALAAVVIAGPTFRADDTDLDITKVGKRSPTLGSLHHHVPSPAHIVPVHHHYVQPIVPHHLGLKKPLIVKTPYGHHGFRSADEEPETHSAESKESKNKCMKEMEAKCDDDVIGKSSESVDGIKVEDIDGDVSDTEVAQSLQMAKEAVDTLQKKLQLAEKNSKMTQWKHGLSESDGRMHENVETAKLALEHMQRNFGNLESMNVHARAFKNAEVHDVNLELKSEEERLAQWKDAIESIQKNVELVRNIEDSFQHNEPSEKSAVLDQGSSLKHEMSDDHKKDAIALKEEKSSGKSTSDTSMMAKTDMEGKSTSEKSSWQAREHEKSSDFRNEMATSASTMSESMTALHSAKEQKSFRSETSQSEKGSTIISGTNGKLLKMTEDKPMNKPMEPSSKPSLKSSENLDMQQTQLDENIAPSLDTTMLMKSAALSQGEKHNTFEQHSATGFSSHKEHDMGSHLDHHRSSSSAMLDKDSHQISLHANQPKGKESEALDHHRLSSSAMLDKDSHQISLHVNHLKGKESEALDHHRLSSPAMLDKDSQQLSLHVNHPKAKETEGLDNHEPLSPVMHGKDAPDMMMKSSDQMSGQSQQTGVVIKPVEHLTSGHHSEKLHHSSSHGAHGKSAEDASLFAPIDMNSLSFRQSLVPTKSWKEAHGSSRGAYGSGSALGGSGYGASGYGAGSGAVGVFPNARVGGCAIPLLLSCSPSVVAGSLAKSHSYAAPSYAASGISGYRSENTNLHSKRDITKISRPAKVNLTPTNKDLKQKTILITDKL